MHVPVQKREKKNQLIKMIVINLGVNKKVEYVYIYIGLGLVNYAYL